MRQIALEATVRLRLRASAAVPRETGADVTLGSATRGLIELEQLHGALRYLGRVFEAGISDL